jgi:hypothetical protein
LDEDRVLVEPEAAASPGHSLPTTSTWLGPSGYERLLARIRGVVRAMLPASATVLVVSKGDEDLLQLDGRRAWHFPREESGKYAGHHPGSDLEAIQHLESSREAGANYLLFPCTAFWWLGHYSDLARHLIQNYELVHADNDTCVIFALNGHQGPVTDVVEARPERYTRFVEEVRDVVRSVLPDHASVLVISSGDDDLLKLGEPTARHFPQGEDGGYAGFHPADDTEAIVHLEKLARAGAEFLLIPATEYWWLDYYQEFERHLEEVHRLVVYQAHVCRIYELNARFRRSDASAADVHPSEAGAPDLDGASRQAHARLPFQRLRMRIARFWGRRR